ncbi:MAG TPA: hypothetical protein DCS31_04420 [Candidatus Competibacteraceae bacterium]|nr:hypothetical protein [Candidatus Competibacteraceae bacterium]
MYHSFELEGVDIGPSMLVTEQNRMGQYQPIVGGLARDEEDFLTYSVYEAEGCLPGLLILLTEQQAQLGVGAGQIFVAEQQSRLSAIGMD